MSLNSQMVKVEKIQYQSALAISGAWCGSSRSKLHEELGWEVIYRHKSRGIIQILNNKTSYLKDKLSPSCRMLFNGNICNTFNEIICKSIRYMNSFSPNTIASWNIFYSKRTY